MWWVFVRDFYRAGQGSAAPAMPSAPLRQAPRTAAVVFAEPEPSDAAPVPITPYLQRLSVDGEHAFGLWDSNVGFSVFSANFERVTRLSSAHCAGHGWIASIHHQQQYAFNEALLNAEEGREGQCLVQARASDEDKWGWLLVDVKPPSARQPAVMVLLRDLSNEKALEEALKQTESSLAVSERGRSAFLSSMSHELRTPLNAIMGFAEMMKSGVFGPLGNGTYQQYAEHIHESGQLLLGKVNDLLDIGSINAQGIALEETSCLVHGLLQEIIEIHSHAAFSRQITLTVDCPGVIELLADRAKLICTVSHFLSNALRHSSEGSTITLSARAVADDGVIISVRDAGEGIPPAQLESIRAALGTDTTYFQIEPGGIGLGLSLSRELAACHGGRVMVDSIRHRGTVVSLILPAERVLRGMPAKRGARG